MKNLSLALVASLIVVPCLAFGQGGIPAGKPGAKGGGPAQMGGGFDMKRMKEMRDKRQKEVRAKISKDLKMTPDQLKQYDALIKKENAEREKQFAAMSKGGARPDFSKMRESMQKARDAHNAAMKKILKADQYTKYEKIMDDMRKQQRSRMGGPGGGAPRAGVKTGA